MIYQSVKILINKTERDSKFIDGYVRGDPLVQAIEFFVMPGMADLVLCEATFAQLNKPEPEGIGNLTPSKIAVYHKVFPSLSVGDVVEIDGIRRYAVQDIGFRKVSSQ